jgi:hypothetical protein
MHAFLSNSYGGSVVWGRGLLSVLSVYLGVYPAYSPTRALGAIKVMKRQPFFRRALQFGALW